MAGTGQKAAEIKIAVPRAYQDDLIARRDRLYAAGLAALVGVTLIYGFLSGKWANVDVFDTVTLTTSLIAWYFERRKPWHYTISDKEITVIWTYGRERFWSWHTIEWARQAIMGVEQAEWRGLPALRLRGPIANSDRRTDWLIAYAPEDTEVITAHILPLIETYRKQYRQESLADRLRS